MSKSTGTPDGHADTSTGGTGQGGPTSTRSGMPASITAPDTAAGNRRLLAARETSPGGMANLAPSQATLDLMHNLGWRYDPPQGYNEVQKLWMPNAPAFTSLAFVYGAPDLFTWKKDADFTTARLVAIADASVDFMPPKPTKRAPLRLYKNTNCIYLASPKNNVWIAYVVAPQSTMQCPAPAPADSVTATEIHSGSADTDYPNVVRIAWDQADYPVIGVRCGKKWCEIGTDKTNAIKNPSHKLTTSGRAGKIKGWHDEQRLATGPNSTVRSKLMGSFFPVENLGDLTSKAMFADWTAVGILYVDGDANEFANSAYGVPALNQKGWGLHRAEEDSLLLRYSGNAWHARIKYPNNATFDLGTVTQTIHTDGHGGIDVPPATARWIWLDKDDALWIRCAEGCCTVDQGIGVEAAPSARSSSSGTKKG